MIPGPVMGRHEPGPQSRVLCFHRVNAKYTNNTPIAATMPQKAYQPPP
jgi:hypothetical protein